VQAKEALPLSGVPRQEDRIASQEAFRLNLNRFPLLFHSSVLFFFVFGFFSLLYPPVHFPLAATTYATAPHS